MLRVGLTGTLGAGKSTVGRLFASWGACRIDADALAREAVEPGTEALARIREVWGEGILDAEGRLDRAALRRAVANDPEARRRLEAIVHPAVGRLRRGLRRRAEREGARVLVEEVPLLFEAGLEGDFDVTVAVDAPRELRRQRVTRARGLSSEEFAGMDAAQWPAERKRRAADFVLENDGTRERLEARARELWERLLERLPAEPGP